MKIYNMITKQVVNSEKIEELDDRFELTDVGAYEKTIKCYFKPTWREADSKRKAFEKYRRVSQQHYSKQCFEDC